MNWVIFIKMKSTTKLINIFFRLFTPQDIDAVLVIEQLAYQSPWHKVQFAQSLDNPNTLAYLMLIDKQLVGYSVALRTPDFTDLLNICIHPQYQHRGLGVQLFQYLLFMADTQAIFIEVRLSNDSALSFYQKLGFEMINLRKKYYTDGEDAKIMRFLNRDKQ